MNLLKVEFSQIFLFNQASQMRDEEIQILQRVFCDENASQDKLLQEQFQQVLSHFQVYLQSNFFLIKQKNSRNRYMKYFDPIERIKADEVDIQKISTQMYYHLQQNISRRDILDNKLKSYKIFYGTHLVDPTPDDLNRVPQEEKKQKNKKLKIKKQKANAVFEEIEKEAQSTTKSQKSQMRSSSVSFLPQILPKSMKVNYESLTGKTVMGVMLEQRQMIKDLRKRFSNQKLNPEQEQFFNHIKQQDYAELQYYLQKDNKKLLINLMDEVKQIFIYNKLQKGNRPIHLAVQLSDLEMVQLFIKYGADLTALNPQGKTAYQLCSVYMNDEISALLGNLDEFRSDKRTK